MKPPPAESEMNYLAEYDNQHEKPSLGAYLFGKGHEVLEETLPRHGRLAAVVEVGAGTGHHFKYLADDSFGVYHMTDASDQALAISQKKYAHIGRDRLVIEKQNGTALGYADASFDRLIATHVLEHLRSPAAVLAEWDRVVRPGGIISLVLPCDPGMLWRFGRAMGPRRQAIRKGLAYDYLMATEHVNAIFNLVTIIRYHFQTVHERWWPMRVPMADLNLFYLCHIEK